MDRGDADLLARSLRKAVGENSAESLDAELAALGWSDALAADPAVAVSALFEIQGEANVSSCALDVVVLHGLGLDPGPAVVLPELGGWAPPGGPATGRGVGTALASRSSKVVVVAPCGAGYVAFEVPAAEVEVRELAGIDTASGMVALRFADLGGEGVAADWPSALALAQLALGHEMVGACRAMLELARQHALARVQFERTLSQFQAVRHHLAEALVAIEAAEAMLESAWIDRSAVSAAMAKAVAGRSARSVSRHCQQVLGGMGFTNEHPFHRYLRRVLLLDQLLGSTDRLTRHLGEQVIETRQLPPPVAL